MCELLCQLACGEGRTTAKDIQHAASTIKSSLGCSILGLLDFLVTPTAYNNFWTLGGCCSPAFLPNALAPFGCS